MAAPTSAVQKLQKILANVGPSTHGLNELSGIYAPQEMCAEAARIEGRGQWYSSLQAVGFKFFEP